MTLAVAALVLWGGLVIAVAGFITPWLLIGIGGMFLTTSLLLGTNRRALILILGAALTLSGISFEVQSNVNKPPWLEAVIDNGSEHIVELEILNRPKRIATDFGGRPLFGVSVNLRAIDDQSVTARGYFTYSQIELVRGQLVRASAKLEPPGRSLRDSFSIRSKLEPEIVGVPDGATNFLNNLRAKYLNSLNGINPDATALVSGLAIGDISKLSEELSEQLRQVSLTHLVAVSGSNCAIVIGLVYLIGVRLGFGRTGRAIISATGLIGYVLLIGPDASVLRAGVMALAVILMLALGRRSWSIGALAIAVMTLLIADPWLASEFGFGLSVLATAGILIFAPAFAEKLSSYMPKILALALSVTIAAQIMCLPLLIQLQSGLLTYSVLANLLAGIAVAPVTVLGMIALVFAPWLPMVAGLLSYLASFGTGWIQLIAMTLAPLPWASIPWLEGVAAVMVSVAAIFAIGFWLKGPSALAKGIGSAATLVIAVATLTAPAAAAILPKDFPQRDWFFVACDVGQGDALLIRSMGRTALIDVGPDENEIEGCLRELGIKEIDLLVLTHFDFDHVGGLGGALRGIEISTALISNFEDTRPNTQIAKELLAAKGLKIVEAKPSLGGKLGAFSWKVISEEGKEAEDSNAGSTVLLFKSAEIQILLTADLGKSSQEAILSRTVSNIDSALPLVLKASHHGSSDQSEEFHSAINPKLAIVSVGEQNGYGHPTASFIEMLKSAGVEILRTDQLGSISLALEEGVLSFAGSGG